MAEAPYAGLVDSANVASRPHDNHRPAVVAMPEALALGADLGEGRFKNMDAQGIQMQVVSWANPLPTVQQAYYSGFSPEVTAQFSLPGWGWHHEVGIHVLRLILSGAFEKYPSLQVISGHWGEMVPFHLQRLDDMLPPKITGLSRTITETYLNHVWVMPSGMFNLPQFQFLHAVIGADRIIWSVDYPYLTQDGTREFISKLPVSEQDREKITHQNAEKLFTL